MEFGYRSSGPPSYWTDVHELLDLILALDELRTALGLQYCQILKKTVSSKPRLAERVELG